MTSLSWEVVRTYHDHLPKWCRHDKHVKPFRASMKAAVADLICGGV